jgi:Ca2+-binding RTX toxin-like protein
MRIEGTNKADTLIGTDGDDVILGKRGNDVLQGGLGNDTLTGDAGPNDYGSDEFIYRFDGSTDVITDFSAAEGDRVVLDSGAGVYSGIMGLGFIGDGGVLTNHLGTASFYFSAVDYDGDGVTDTLVTSDYADGSLIILGNDPATLTGAAFLGG